MEYYGILRLPLLEQAIADETVPSPNITKRSLDCDLFLECYC